MIENSKNIYKYQKRCSKYDIALDDKICIKIAS